MFGISGFELSIILLALLILFGPEHLPRVARDLGRARGQFTKVRRDLEQAIREETRLDDAEDGQATGRSGGGGGGPPPQPSPSDIIIRE